MEMKMTRCEMCGYYWRDENERYACCHYEGPEEWAPCEQDGPEVGFEFDEDTGTWVK